MRKTLAAVAAILLGGTAAASAETITIATVNNGDMVIMQKLSSQWEKQTGNKVNWVVLEENVLRQRVTTDIATKGGQFDIVTISAYETPIWGKQGWLADLSTLGNDYDYADILPKVKNGLTVDGKMYAVPFYAESSFVMYRKDLFQQAGLTMPDSPTYDDITKAADKLTDKSKEQYGICLRGKPGWGENMAFLGTLVNTTGGRWFDMNWQPQLTTDPWKKAINYYVDLMKRDGPPGATSNGFNENLALFSQGHCGMWIDATVAAGMVSDPATSKVAGNVGFAKAPTNGSDTGAGWSWTWALGIPSSSQKQDAAKAFVKWATSKDYVKLVASSDGWLHAPPGTRQSTYDSADYQKAAPFAKAVLAQIQAADPSHPTKDPVPYTGVQYATIPEFQGIGTTVGQDIAGALAGQTTVDQALQQAQDSTLDTMQQGGYIK